MKTITIDGEDYWTLDDHEAVPIIKLASEDGYKILKKVEKPVSSPLQEWQKAAGMYFFQGDDRGTVLRNSNATANWLVDELEAYAKNFKGCQFILAEAKRLIGRKD